MNGSGKPHPSISSRVVEPGVVLTRFAGYITYEVSQRGAAELGAIVSSMRAPVWINDCTSLIGFEPRVMASGASWSDAFTAQGGRYVFVATQSPLVIMAASTMAMAAQVRVRCLPTLDAATKAARRRVETPSRASIIPLA